MILKALYLKCLVDSFVSSNYHYILSDMAAVDGVRTADPVDGRCDGQRRLDLQTP